MSGGIGDMRGAVLGRDRSPVRGVKLESDPASMSGAAFPGGRATFSATNNAEARGFAGRGPAAVRGDDCDRPRVRDMDMESDEGGRSDDADMDGDADGDGDEVGPLQNGKRKRPMSVSCELCKQRKVKCDRGQPSCGWCTRNNQHCEYKERKKPGLRAGYGRELEARLDRLEEVLRKHSELLRIGWPLSSSPVGGGGNYSAPPPAPPLPPPSGRGVGPNVCGSIHGGSASSLPGTPVKENPIASPEAHSAMPGQPAFAGHRNILGGYGIGSQTKFGSSMRQFHRPSEPQISPIHTTNNTTQAPPLQSPICAISATQTPQSQTVPPHSRDHDLPPYELLYTLVIDFFKHVYPWCPILHRKNTLDQFLGQGEPQEADDILLHAIVATTLRYNTDPRLTEEKRRQYHDVSKNKVLLYGMESSSVKALQALVILALDLIGSSNGPPAWNVMALITRSVVQLGLAVEGSPLPNAGIYTLRATNLSEPRDFGEDEERRRLFWMIYLLDRYATIATAFEFALDDREIDRMLPCRDDLWYANHQVETRHFKSHEGQGHNNHHQHHSRHNQPNRPENLGPFSYYIEVLGILSKIHKFLKQPFDITVRNDVETWQTEYGRLNDMLNRWRSSLPREYGETSRFLDILREKDTLKVSGEAETSSSVGWIMLHATIHTTVIRLHSSAGYPTTRNNFFMPSNSAVNACMTAVKGIYSVVRFVLEHHMLDQLGPPFAFSIWVAARLLLVHGSTVTRQLAPEISFFVDALRQMGKYWPVARRYYELLERVQDEHHASERSGVVAGSVTILADMRRTAYDLDFLISRQPRQTCFGGSGGHCGTVPNNNNSREGGGHSGGGAFEMSMGAIPPEGGGTLAGERFPGAVPLSRPPAANDYDLLELFGMFNWPPARDANVAATFLQDAQMAMGMGFARPGMEGVGHLGNEINITNFELDVDRDWLQQQHQQQQLQQTQQQQLQQLQHQQQTQQQHQTQQHHLGESLLRGPSHGSG